MKARVVQFRSNWNNADQVSTFYLNLNNDSTNANQNIGTQIMYNRLYPTHPASWQNINRKRWIGSDNAKIQQSIHYGAS